MKAVLLLSGGIDSTVALASALSDGIDVRAVSFDYGQTHVRELVSAAAVADHYGISRTVIDLRGIFGSSSALTSGQEIPETHASGPDATVVPGRNLVMLSVALSIAEQDGAALVIIGANADDNLGYRDCRPDFISAVDNVARLGTGNRLRVYAPFVAMTKREVIAKGAGLDAPLDLTWSCYRGNAEPCERCGACEAIREAKDRT